MINYKTRIKQLKAERLSYVAFLKSGETEDDEDDWMLITEIERIQKQIDLLEAKPIGELLKKYDFWEIEKESTINYKPLTPRDIKVIASN